MTDDAYSALRAVRPEDLFLRYDVAPQRVERVVSDGRAVAWTSTHPFRGQRWVTAVGDDVGATAAPVARLVALADEAGEVVGGLTVPSTDARLLPAHLAPVDAARWCWWWTGSEPAVRAGEADTVRLAPDDPRIEPLLAHSASASVRPGDQHVVQWLGALAGTELVACAAHTEHQPGVPHLASVVTRPDHRGRGLASDLCARLTREALHAGATVVTLGMYADNAVARGVYTRLGFAVDKDFTSGSLPARGDNGRSSPAPEAPGR